MNTVVKEEVVDTVVLSWLAGFYEGEGTPRSAGGDFGLVVYQKDTEVLNFIQHSFGGNIYYNGSIHYWQLNGKVAAKLALEFLKYMHHPQRIEQLTKALVLTGQLTPRTKEEASEATQRKSEKNLYVKSRERYTERLELGRNIRTYIKEHPEIVEKLSTGASQ